MQINSFNSKIFIETLLEERLEEAIDSLKPGKIFILVDENTNQYCLPQLYKLMNRQKVYVKSIPQGEANKTILTITEIWDFLQKNDADRNSLLINLGGGIILDIGGFAASTFKRGMKFINIPTTLLSMVDASVGGKVGFNFNDYKNHIGLFSQPSYVIVYPGFLKSLEERHIYSGWAEMIKHGLIHSAEHLEYLLSYDPVEIDEVTMNNLIGRSIQIKNYFSEKDPFEKDIRKTLNFGHTIGHAMESFAFKHKSILHGEAVALGMISEMYLSRKILSFPEERERMVTEYILKHYTVLRIPESSEEQILAYMKQDKKNQQGTINFTLLKDFGQPIIDQYLDTEVIIRSLEYYKKLSEAYL